MCTGGGRGFPTPLKLQTLDLGTGKYYKHFLSDHGTEKEKY